MKKCKLIKKGDVVKDGNKKYIVIKVTSNKATLREVIKIRTGKMCKITFGDFYTADLLK